MLTKYRKFLFICAIATISLSCSMFSAAPQLSSHQKIDKQLLENNNGNNLSYIGKDGNIWLLNDNNSIQITNFDSKSKDIPIQFYEWSPDGEKIAVQTSKGVHLIYLSNYINDYFAGNNTFLSGFLVQHWSPDSQKILMTQYGFRTLDLFELSEGGELSKRVVVTPLNLGSMVIWLPDSQKIALSEDKTVNVTGQRCYGLFNHLKISIINTQDNKNTIIYDGWGDSFGIFSSKVVVIGGDGQCSEFPVIFDLETSKTTILNDIAPEEHMRFNNNVTNPIIFTVSSTIDASQKILLLNENDLSYVKIEFGDMSKLIGFKSDDSSGYFFSKDKKILFFNKDVFWGGGIFKVEIQSKSIYPLVGDQSVESEYIFNLASSSVIDVLDNDNLLVSGSQNGQINALYYLDIKNNQIEKLGYEAFWAEPLFFGQSKNGLLLIQAKSIQAQTTNIYLVNVKGDVIKMIPDASQPMLQPYMK